MQSANKEGKKEEDDKVFIKYNFEVFSKIFKDSRDLEYRKVSIHNRRKDFALRHFYLRFSLRIRKRSFQIYTCIITDLQAIVKLIQRCLTE